MTPRFVSPGDVLPGDSVALAMEGFPWAFLVYCEVESVEVKEHGTFVRGRFLEKAGPKERLFGVMLPKSGEILLLSRPLP